MSILEPLGGRSIFARALLTVWPLHLLWLGLVAPAPQLLSGGELRAGIATTDITPPIPYRMSGYFSERLSTGTKDPLLAKAIVFEQDGTRAAMVFCDLIGIAPQTAAKSRQLASQAADIPVGHIVLMATHSHTGPLYWGALRNHLHQRIINERGSDPYETVDYPAELAEKLAHVVAEAATSLQAVSLRAGYAEERRLSFNRRFHMKDGSVRFNPGQRNPDIVRVAGPIDPQVGLVACYARQEELPLAMIVSFALHLDTVGGTEYSADYPGYVQEHLSERFGADFTSLFGAGTCGDINHVDVTVQGRRSAAEIGKLLAQTVEQEVPRLSIVAEPDLGVRRATVEAPLQVFSTQEIDAARRNMEFVDSRRLSFLERVEAYKIMAVQQRESRTLPIEVQVFRLSRDTAIVTLPGEVFVELGIAIKSESPFPTTLVVELANDAPGYIPTRQAFAEGSYETVNSRIQSGSGEKMVETAVRLLNELASGGD